jgi:hypothetical protein
MTAYRSLLILLAAFLLDLCSPSPLRSIHVRENDELLVGRRSLVHASDEPLVDLIKLRAYVKDLDAELLENSAPGGMGMHGHTFVLSAT